LDRAVDASAFLDFFLVFLAFFFVRPALRRVRAEAPLEEAAAFEAPVRSLGIAAGL
jgi:hypothetical protein